MKQDLGEVPDLLAVRQLMGRIGRSAPFWELCQGRVSGRKRARVELHENKWSFMR